MNWFLSLTKKKKCLKLRINEGQAKVVTFTCILCNFKCFTSSGKFLLLIDVTLVVVPLTDWESLLTPLILIDEVAPDRIPEGLG